MKKFNHTNLFLVSLMVLCFSYFANGQGKAEIIITKDLEYRKALNYQGKMESVKFDLYQKSDSFKLNKPVIILVHGGGFQSGDKGFTKSQGNFYPDLASKLADLGYLVISANYRLWPDYPIESFSLELGKAISDIHCLVKHLKGKSKKYHIDKRNILLCGDSAGGAIVINTFLKNPELYVGCINLWGGLPPYGEKTMNNHIVNRFPIKTDLPPVCIVHGTIDDIVPYVTSQNLSDSLSVMRCYNELHTLQGASHYPVKRFDQIAQIVTDFCKTALFTSPQNPEVVKRKK